MGEKLRYAIFNCTEMDGDFRTTEIDVPGWSSPLSDNFPSSSPANQPLDLFHSSAPS